ncbi:MAG: DNA-3-methyladenine glycosylase [Thermodesulfobacteriota bacterium]
MEIDLPERFSVEWMLNHIRTSSYGIPYRFADLHVLRRALWLDGTPVVAEFDLSQTGTMKVRLVSRQALGRRPGRSGVDLLESLAAQARFLWGLDGNAEEPYEAIASDPHMAPLLARFGPLRVVRAADLYEALLVTVIGQQVSVPSAQAVRRRLIRNMGTGIEAGAAPGMDTYYLYPTPRQILTADESALRAQGVSRQKSAYLREIAECAAAGDLDLAVFATLSDEDAIARLCRIRGVGRWTAEIALMRGLGRSDIFAAGDLGLQAAVQELWGMPQRPSEKTLRGIAGNWRGWRSYAAFYLWMTLQCRAL